ncbi:putative conserved secreted protein, partial [Operophtera brumata]
GAFLSTVAGISAFVGFSATLAAAKKADPKYFNKVAGTSCLCYGVWKLSGAKDLKEFRIKMGNLLPILPKNNPPRSRTEFSGLNDLLTYISDDYGKSSAKDK